MSCETPCVAFDHSGPTDIIKHKKTGYLAKYKNSEDLANGIKYYIENKQRNKKLSKNSRKKALKEYSSNIQAEKYFNLYNELIN